MQIDPLILILLVVMGAGGLAALAVIATKRKAIVLLVGAMMFASTLGLPLDWRGRLVHTTLLPLQQNRSTLFLVFGVATGLLVLVHATWSRGKGVSLPAVMLLLMAYYAALMRAANGAPQDGLFSLLYATATLIPLSLAVKIALDGLDDFLAVFRTLAVVNLVWIGLVMFAIVINHNDVIMGKEQRFVGLLSNPQHAGSYLAVMLAVSLYLALNDTNRRFHLVWIGLLGVDLVLLGWTGSRTGLGMAVLGVTGVLYSRAGRAILFLPIIALFMAVMIKVLQIAGIDALGFGRLASTANTRGEAWRTLLQQGLDNPILGTGMENAVRSENGFLFGFASFGLGMVLLILILMAVSGYLSLQLLAKRNLLPRQYRSLADFLLAYQVVYFAGSVFEGYMMARVAANLSFFIIFSTMAVFLVRLANEYGAAGTVEEFGDGYEDPVFEYTEDLPEPV